LGFAVVGILLLTGLAFAAFVLAAFDFVGFSSDLARAALFGIVFRLGVTAVVVFLLAGLAFAGFSGDLAFDFGFGAFCSFLVASFAASLACFAAFFAIRLNAGKTAAVVTILRISFLQYGDAIESVFRRALHRQPWRSIVESAQRIARLYI
jgi:hypothetical protein